jgi:hypothetical protein
MERVNKIRVALKHYGIEPSLTHISSTRETVSAFVEDSAPDLFGVKLVDISLSDFVRAPEARSLLESAEEQWADGRSTDALGDLSRAFEAVLKDYKKRKLVWADRSVFDMTSNMTFVSGFFQGASGREEEFIDKVIESLRGLDRAVSLIGFGVDLRRYGRFHFLTPHVTYFPGGRIDVSPRPGMPVPTTKDYEFCRDFVVSTALHLGEFDYDYDLWAARQGRTLDQGPAQPDQSP